MYKGIYIALSGAVLKRKNLDIFAQNIANANTSGYKKGRITFKDYIIPVDNKSGLVPDGRVMTELSGEVIDFSKGTIARTGNTLDLAINGEGFFALEGGKYTRSGSFEINGDGYLTNRSGIKVLGDGGPVAVQGSSIDISSSGEVIVDDIPVGKLKIVDFPDKRVLKKLSGGVFVTEETGEAARPDISQGFLEASNVDVIQEMIQLMASHRDFESYQKMIQVFDEASSRITNEMGK